MAHGTKEAAASIIQYHHPHPGILMYVIRISIGHFFLL